MAHGPSLLKANTPVALSKHEHAQTKRGAKGTPGGSVSSGLIRYSGKKGFHSNGEWGRGTDGWAVCTDQTDWSSGLRAAADKALHVLKGTTAPRSPWGTLKKESEQFNVESLKV